MGGYINDPTFRVGLIAMVLSLCIVVWASGILVLLGGWCVWVDLCVNPKP